MELERQLEAAIEYASETGSFHRMNLVEKAEHVCVYGLGKYFEDAFIQQEVRRRFQVDLLCDGNYEKVKNITGRAEYAGLKGISLDELKEMKNVYVIVMLGNPTEALEQLGGVVGSGCCAAYNDVALDDIVSKDEKYRQVSHFKEQRDVIWEGFRLLEDEKSRETYVNVMCNRIAPHLSQMSYAQMYQEPQYFPEDLFRLSKHECVVDGGAYTGDTLQSFLRVSRNCFDAYYAFEMDRENFEKLQSESGELEKSIQNKIRYFQKGLWDRKGKVSYGRRASDDSYSIYNGEDTEWVETVCLDECLGGNRVSFIKMDIEGAEWKALQGAKKIIAVQKPKMAVCVYHRLEDMWKIPVFLKKLVPEYKIAVRHHAKFWVSETVCYAYRS